MSSPISIRINGQNETISPVLLSEFITQRYQKPEHIVAELNGQVVKRINWSQTSLKTDDILELLVFVGGG
jgi:thiamine biosynthesis protein ThiS